MTSRTPAIALRSLATLVISFGILSYCGMSYSIVRVILDEPYLSSWSDIAMRFLTSAIPPLCGAALVSTIAALWRFGRLMRNHAPRHCERLVVGLILRTLASVVAAFTADGLVVVAGCLFLDLSIVEVDLFALMGLIIGSLALLCAALVAGLSILLSKPTTEPDGSSCSLCGYDLCGLDVERCPECGTPATRTSTAASTTPSPTMPMASSPTTGRAQ